MDSSASGVGAAGGVCVGAEAAGPQKAVRALNYLFEPITWQRAPTRDITAKWYACISYTCTMKSQQFTSADSKKSKNGGTVVDRDLLGALGEGPRALVFS